VSTETLLTVDRDGHEVSTNVWESSHLPPVLRRVLKDAEAKSAQRRRRQRARIANRPKVLAR